MPQKAQGKSQCRELLMTILPQTSPDDGAAREWNENIVWPDGPSWSHLDSFIVQCSISNKPIEHRCRDCAGKPRCCLKTGMVTQSSKLGYQTWAIAANLDTTNVEDVSSMRLHRNLEIRQESVWNLVHQLKGACDLGSPLFSNPVEADDTYKAELNKIKHAGKKLNAGRVSLGGTVVAEVKGRKTGKVVAKVVPDTKAKSFQVFVRGRTEEIAQVCTDGWTGCAGFDRPHDTVNHIPGE